MTSEYGPLAIEGIVYLTMGSIVGLLGLTIFKNSREKTWFKLIGLPFIPLLFLLGLLLIPYTFVLWWLYPEKHLTKIDFEGTEEEKKKLSDYRLACRKRGFFRIFAENIGFAQKTRPPWPFAD